jgi:hypothetical protein
LRRRQPPNIITCKKPAFFQRNSGFPIYYASNMAVALEGRAQAAIKHIAPVIIG